MDRMYIYLGGRQGEDPLHIFDSFALVLNSNSCIEHMYEIMIEEKPAVRLFFPLSLSLCLSLLFGCPSSLKASSSPRDLSLHIKDPIEQISSLSSLPMANGKSDSCIPRRPLPPA